MGVCARVASTVCKMAGLSRLGSGAPLGPSILGHRRSSSSVLGRARTRLDLASGGGQKAMCEGCGPGYVLLTTWCLK
eukprot:3190234-Pyramimonas_sp.AAC.1